MGAAEGIGRLNLGLKRRGNENMDWVDWLGLLTALVTFTLWI